jgi:hypothetical protein
MATSQTDIIQRWVDRCTGETDRPNFGRHSNVFAVDDHLYSYGSHFTLAMHLPWGFLLNGDRYSSSTTQQQWKVRRVMDGGRPWERDFKQSKHPYVIIPFEALAAARVDLETVVPVDSKPDRFEPVQKTGPAPLWATGEYLGEWVRESNAKPNGDGTYTYDERRHFLGECVFRATVYGPAPDFDSREAYFISAWDNQDRGTYFLSELPHAVDSLDEAYEALKPETVKRGEREGRRIVRQGDIFAVETEVTTRALTKAGAVRERMAPLLGTNHVATEVAVLPNGATLARGFLHHKPPFRDSDHRRQRIGNNWAVIVKNTVPITKENR